LIGALPNGIAFGADWKILPGHVPRALSELQPLDRLPATNLMRLAIGVPLRDPAGLDDFLARLMTPPARITGNILRPRSLPPGSAPRSRIMRRSNSLRGRTA